jgi:hypothetical protein
MEKLNILWTTDNEDTAINMLIMYALNSKMKGWWDHVNVIIWGASAKLVAANTRVQSEILEMINQGVHVEACKECSDRAGVTERLIKLGIDVKYMGVPFTEYIKAGEKLITI